MGNFRGGGKGGYKRDHGSLPGGGWVTADAMVVYRGWGGGGGATEETMGLYRGQEGLQKRPWASIRGGGTTEETMGLYQGEGGYRRNHGSLSGGGGLQARPWVFTRGRGGGAKQILWVSSRGWGAIRGGHHLHLFWWVLSLYSSFDQFP